MSDSDKLQSEMTITIHRFQLKDTLCHPECQFTDKSVYGLCCYLFGEKLKPVNNFFNLRCVPCLEQFPSPVKSKGKCPK